MLLSTAEKIVSDARIDDAVGVISQQKDVVLTFLATVPHGVGL